MARSARTPGTALAVPKKDLKVRMRLRPDKETKGSVRYQEVNERGVPITNDDDGMVLQTVYMRKSAVRRWLGVGNATRDIEITIKALD